MNQVQAANRVTALDTTGAGKLHPFVGILEDHRPGRETSRGLFHLLTGEGIEIDAKLLSRLMAGDSADDVEAIREALRARWHLADSVQRNGQAGDPLAPWLDHFLTVPAHTPGLATVASESTTLYRPQGLACCRLPRDARIPRVIRENLDPMCGQLLQQAANHVTLGEALGRLGVDPETALQLISLLTDPDRQMIRLVASRRQIDDLCAQHQYPMQNFVVGESSVAAGQHYEDDILDPSFNFDWLEPTVAHSFRLPTAALNGHSYGAALFEAIKPFATVPRDRLRILEVGGGTGSLALDFLQAARQAAGGTDCIEYHILDRSPVLLEAQRELLRGHGFEIIQHRADAQRNLPPGLQFDYVVANEVIADFEVASGTGTIPEQVGATAFIRLLAETLAPGGRAYIIEYGSLGSPPKRVDHLAHEEHAVEFGDLRRCAESIGLEATTCGLGAFLKVRSDTPMLIAQQERHLCLRAVFADHGMDFESCAYDQRRFDALYGSLCSRLGLIRLDFAPLSAGHHFGPDLSQFLVLILDRPRPSGGGGQTKP